MLVWSFFRWNAGELKGGICILLKFFFFFFLTKDPRGLQPICSLSAGSDGNLLLLPLPPRRTHGQRMRVEFAHLSIIICCSLEILLPAPPLYRPFFRFFFFFTSNGQPTLESALFNDDLWAPSWGCCQIAVRPVGEGLGGDAWRVNKKLWPFLFELKRLINLLGKILRVWEINYKSSVL